MGITKVTIEADGVAVSVENNFHRATADALVMLNYECVSPVDVSIEMAHDLIRELCSLNVTSDLHTTTETYRRKCDEAYVQHLRDRIEELTPVERTGNDDHDD